MHIKTDLYSNYTSAGNTKEQHITITLKVSDSIFSRMFRSRKRELEAELLEVLANNVRLSESRLKIDVIQQNCGGFGDRYLTSVLCIRYNP